MIKILFFAFFVFSLLNSCSSGDGSDSDKIQELENKLKEQEIKIQTQEKERLDSELEAKKQELSELKTKIVSSKHADNHQDYYAKNSGVFPEASSRLLGYDDVASLNSRELKIMRNEIFARHGYIFKTNDMINHFNGEPWYRPLYDDVTGKLTAIEKENVNYIKKFE